jgi:hypothetical protein
MRIDLYTKIILTLIVLLLAVIALKPLFQPQPARAEGKLSNIQLCCVQREFLFFDTRTGDIWEYNGVLGTLDAHFKVTELGETLTK